MLWGRGKAKALLSAVVLLVFAAAALLSGCGQQAGTAGEGKVIKVGVIAPLSGDAKTFGESVKNGVELAVSELKDGKVGDFKIQLVTGDDRNDPKEATNLATKMITEDKVNAIIGAVTSKCSIPVSEIAQQYKVLMISPTSTAEKVTVDDRGKRKDYVFRVCFIDPFQGTVAAKFALSDLHAKTAAILYDQGNDYTVGLAEVFKKDFEAGGGKVVAMESYTTQDTDFSAILSKIAPLNPDILYLPDYYQKVSLIAKQARDKGIKATFLGGDGWDSPSIDQAAMNGGYFTNHYSVSDPSPRVQEWVRKYQAKYGKQPDAFATLGYEAAQVLFKAIETANSGDPTKLRDTIQNISVEAVTAKISFDKNGNPVKPLAIIQYKDNKQVFVKKITP